MENDGYENLAVRQDARKRAGDTPGYLNGIKSSGKEGYRSLPLPEQPPVS